jgi:bile acid:Na+ symporter, BASS family
LALAAGDGPIRSVLNRLTNAFPLWVLLSAMLAVWHPPLVTWFRGPYIVWGLAVIMLGMGMTLSVADFRRVLAMPRVVAVGFVAQYAIMPLLGYSLAMLLRLPTPLAVGLILVSCCPGGTASNVVTYIARANVALSVLMTMCSTFGAIVMIIALICASIIGQNADDLLKSGPLLLFAVGLLHAGGFGLGYGFARAFGYDRIIRRTVSIEVGMQNSGLGAVLARQHFADPLTVLPAAISATVHSVLGSILAAGWRSNAATVPNDRPSTVALPAEPPG